MHAFTAPPPPLRFPPVQTVNNDVNGVAAAGWGKAALPSLSVKFPNGVLLFFISCCMFLGNFPLFLEVRIFSGEGIFD